MYNAARLVLARLHPTLVSGWIDDLTSNADEGLDTPCVLVKTHAFDASLARRADAVLCTHRDLRSTAASMLRMGFAQSEAGALDAIGHAIGHAEAWESIAALAVSHDEIRRDPGSLVGRVADALGVQLSPEDCGAIAAAIPRAGPDEGPGYDPVTLLHRAHIRRDGEAPPALSPAGKRELEIRFGEWSHRHGYA